MQLESTMPQKLNNILQQKKYLGKQEQIKSEVMEYNIGNFQKYETYRKVKLLGEGSFGKAYLVESESDKTLCVLKEIDMSKLSDQIKKEALQEAKILSVLKHPNIIKFKEVFNTKLGKLCIVMDYAEAGDLQKKIKENHGRYFSETQVLDWFTQICLAIKHVHDRKILHRDIKSQNVFLSRANTCLLGDFGIARVLSSTRDFAKTVVGTPYYLSPEIIENKRYSFKSDIWSLGVLLYELLALKPPFHAASLQMLGLKIIRGSYPPIPSHYSRELKLLVSQILQTDQAKRPTIGQILSSRVIQIRAQHFLSESLYGIEFTLQFRVMVLQECMLFIYGVASDIFNVLIYKQIQYQVIVSNYLQYDNIIFCNILLLLLCYYHCILINCDNFYIIFIYIILYYYLYILLYIYYDILYYINYYYMIKQICITIYQIILCCKIVYHNILLIIGHQMRFIYCYIFLQLCILLNKIKKQNNYHNYGTLLYIITILLLLLKINFKQYYYQSRVNSNIFF